MNKLHYNTLKKISRKYPSVFPNPVIAKLFYVEYKKHGVDELIRQTEQHITMIKTVSPYRLCLNDVKFHEKLKLLKDTIDSL